MVKVIEIEKSHQWPQILAVVTAGFLALGDGLHFGWCSPAIPKLLQNGLQFEITTEEISYVTMIAPLGYLLGCPLSSLLIDNIGRKKSLLLVTIPQIIAWILIGTSVNVPMLYAARLLTGVAEGAIFTILPVYLAEISEPKIRGMLGTTLTIGIMSGVLLINCYGSFLPIRTSAYLSIAIPLLFIVTFLWMPESPYFYLMKERPEDARKSLKTLRRMHNVEKELTQLSFDVKRQISEPGSLKDVFTIKTNLKAFFIVTGVRTLQQFSGVSVFLVYTQVIFQQSESGISAVGSSIIYVSTEVIMTCAGSFLIDRFGRKPMLIVSTIGTTVFLCMEALYFYFQYFGYDLSAFTWVPLTGMMMYMILYGVGLGVAPNIMMGELFSASIKAKAIGVMNIHLAVCLSSSYKVFEYLDEAYGMHVPFFFFAAVCAVGVLFSFFIPETKGKSLEEIQQILRGNSKTDDNKSRQSNEIEEGNITKF